MSFLARLGPGAMMAATAVGVSHLVHATRAGAGYGLSMTLLVIVIVLLKYPAFRFAVEYASATGNSLVHAYVRLGRFAVGWLLLTMLLELFVGTSVLSLVTAGFLISVLELPVGDGAGAIAVIVLTAALLFAGRYARVERIVKILVVLFSLMTVLATVIAIPRLGSAGREVFPPVPVDLSTAGFVIAMTGYMPLPLAVAIFQSIWVREKRRISDYPASRAVFDLNAGWWLTAVLAICFMVMGTAVLFQTGTEMPASAPAFATMLFSIFTGLAGDWILPLLAVGGFAVIWSTLIAVLDAVPRIFDRLLYELRGEDKPGRDRYTVFLLVQVAGAAMVLSLFLGDFATFVDISAGLTFLIAPAVAYFNFRAVTSDEVCPGFEPEPWLVTWNRISIVAFCIFAIAFLVLRFR